MNSRSLSRSWKWGHDNRMSLPPWALTWLPVNSYAVIPPSLPSAFVRVYPGVLGVSGVNTDPTSQRDQSGFRVSVPTGCGGYASPIRLK